MIWIKLIGLVIYTGGIIVIITMMKNGKDRLQR